MASSKQILAMTGDLFFAVRLSDVIRSLGHVPQLVDTPAQLVEALATRPSLVILDLALVDRWEGALREAKANPTTASVPVLAFGPHMDVAAQQRGRAAGADRVVANSKFMADLPALIAQLAP
jgi:CheY-like chemotaxis protein